ncbi:hypothetical protein ACQKKE_08450 [Desemzia incerta]|uniref:hypothetical protein n=1 Tax=Desemzia incerta TaxID=82801 RepID=UPI003D000696
MKSEREIIYEALMEIYPDRIYPSIGKIKEYPIYEKIKEYAKRHEKNVTGILTEMKFEKFKKYDTKRMLDLIEQYDVTQTTFADFLNVERQMINSKIKGKVNFSFFWKERNITTNEQKFLIEEMIERKSGCMKIQFCN